MKYSFFINYNLCFYNDNVRYRYPKIEKLKDDILKITKENVGVIIGDMATITLHFYYKIPAKKSLGRPIKWACYSNNRQDITKLTDLIITTLDGVLFSDVKNIVSIDAHKYHCLSERNEGIKIEIKTIN